MTQLDDPWTGDAGHPRRTDLDLALVQVEAIDRFTAHLRRTQASADAATTREGRMDARRLGEVLRRQHDALVAHCDRQLAATTGPALTRADRRVVIAHRHAWFAGRVAQELQAHGLRVAATTDNGAEAVGVAVAEQPDLLLVEDALPMTTGVQVLQQVRRFSAGTVVAAQVPYGDAMVPLLDAGAAAVFVRNVPPADVAARLVELLEPAGR